MNPLHIIIQLALLGASLSAVIRTLEQLIHKEIIEAFVLVSICLIWATTILSFIYL